MTSVLKVSSIGKKLTAVLAKTQGKLCDKIRFVESEKNKYFFFAPRCSILFEEKQLSSWPNIARFTGITIHSIDPAEIEKIMTNAFPLGN